MPDVIINVTPQQTASVEVDVDNVASYYYELAKQWAISPDLVEQLDYSSKYYANKSEEAVDSILADAGFIAVSQDLTNIDTVANSITNVNAVANDVTNINLVADDLTNIDSVAGSISNVNSVASDLTNINSVASDLTNIDNVAADLTNIDNVAADLTNIDSVASNATNINTCASNASNINTVASSIANVNTVASDKTNIDTVAGISGDITTVAGISTDVTSVASISSAVSAVNTNSTNINTCATNIADINTCAANISTINDKVSKAGDTMTGDLTINKATPLYILKNTDLDKTSTTAPSSNIDSAVQVQDKNGQYISNFYTAHTQGNEFQQGLDLTRTINNVEGHAYFGIGLNANNEEYVSASNGVKQSITNWAFPSSRYDNLALGASGTQYTAPADGYVYVGGTQFANSGYMFLSNDANGMQVVAQPPNVSTFEVRCIMPLAKGQQYTIFYGDLYINVFRFIYANGEA